MFAWVYKFRYFHGFWNLILVGNLKKEGKWTIPIENPTIRQLTAAEMLGSRSEGVWHWAVSGKVTLPASCTFGWSPAETCCCILNSFSPKKESSDSKMANFHNGAGIIIILINFEMKWRLELELVKFHIFVHRCCIIVVESIESVKLSVSPKIWNLEYVILKTVYFLFWKKYGILTTEF